MKKSERSRRVALVGCGRIAFLLERDPLRYKPCTHLGALRLIRQNDPGIQVVGFADPYLERAQAAKKFYGDPNALATTNFMELLDTQPDVVAIAAPTDAHFALTAQALRAGVPRIVLEKPVVSSLEEVERLQQLVRNGNSLILPNYERRYLPKYQRLKKLIQHNGPTCYRGFFAAGGKDLYPNKKNEGVLLHDTTHLVDLVQFLFGKIRTSKILAAKNRHLLWLEHTDGSAGTIETVLNLRVFHLELEIRLKNRRLVVGNGFIEEAKIVASRHYQGLRGYGIPVRKHDTPPALNQNPFIRLYRTALYGRPDNRHFYQALDNVALLLVRA
ncbi:MAG: Gfo/Idh/MocA family oxidoreductase [Turneriella sp.]|nr:Gfo/Idh/MocA family oxidoreductase [Leptospiraceae bacterium]MCX7631813.1 Gfo/Idh/MocA family oxidoreductase [Turneriella sp.]